MRIVYFFLCLLIILVVYYFQKRKDIYEIRVKMNEINGQLQGIRRILLSLGPFENVGLGRVYKFDYIVDTEQDEGWVRFSRQGDTWIIKSEV